MFTGDNPAYSKWQSDVNCACLRTLVLSQNPARLHSPRSPLLNMLTRLVATLGFFCVRSQTST